MMQEWCNFIIGFIFGLGGSEQDAESTTELVLIQFCCS